MAGSGLYNPSMAGSINCCIAVDWGSTNRRAWALGPDGRALAERADSAGLLAVQDRQFARSLESFLGDWISAGATIPVVIVGMAGSRMGWAEVPYVAAPAPLADLAQHLMQVGRIAGSDCWIVPRVSASTLLATIDRPVKTGIIFNASEPQHVISPTDPTTACLHLSAPGVL